jgi:glycosyltransferase involved in cell wall biosynthesis
MMGSRMLPHPIIAHNFYSSKIPSGENSAVEADVRLLRSAGLTVETLFERSDSIPSGPFGLVATLPKLFGSRDADRYVANAVRKRGANILHVHNVYPLISPSVINAAKVVGIPVVATIHNYRLACPKGTFFRDGAICTSCEGHRFPWPSVRYSCYRGSRVQSSAIAAAMMIHSPTWRLVDRYIAVSSTIADFLTRLGVAVSRIRVRPALPSKAGSPAPKEGSGVLYAGRLEKEKGIELLLGAWAKLEDDSSRPLVIAGAGSAEDLVRSAAAQRTDIQYLGLVDQDRIAELIDETAATCIPSIWYEGLPTIFVQAISHARPVLVTTVGSLARVVSRDNAWIVEPDVASIAAALADARSGSHVRGLLARELYDREYSESVALDRLQTIYSELLNPAPVPHE